MTKIARKTQLIFGASSGLHQIAQFGSLAASAPVYTTDPDTIQALSNYLEGWFSGVIGENSPAIEDMNALCYLYAYQLAYLMQAGVPEWNATTTYYIGSFASNGLGNIYASITDTNLNHALTDTANWKEVTAGVSIAAINPATQSPYVLAVIDNGRVFEVNSANGAQQFTLPAAATSSNFSFTVKDVGGVMALNNATIVRNSSEQIEGVAATFTCAASYGTWTFACNGTSWSIL